MNVILIITIGLIFMQGCDTKKDIKENVIKDTKKTSVERNVDDCDVYWAVNRENGSVCGLRHKLN